MDSKFFGPRSYTGMSSKHPDGKNSPIALRLRAVMLVEKARTQDAFAERLKVEKKRLNNALVGYPLSIEVAQKVKQAVPGITRDWLYDGDEGGLPVSLRDRLREAETRLRQAAGRDSGATAGAVTKNLSTTSTAKRSTASAS